MVAKKKAPAKKAGGKKAGGKKAPPKSTRGKGRKPPAGWFRKGDEGFKQKEKQDAQNQQRADRMKPRIWLPVGGSKRLVFLDDGGFYIHEHNLPVDGKYGKLFVTCTDEWLPCPICAADENPTYTAYYTVIDVDGWTSKKDGKKHTNVKCLYPAKSGAIKVLEKIKKKLKEKKQTLIGRAFEVSRETGDDPNCGRDFDFLKVTDLKKLKPEERKPFDYETIFAPLSDDDLAAIGYGGGSTPPAPYEEGGEEGGESEGGSGESGVGSLL